MLIFLCSMKLIFSCSRPEIKDCVNNGVTLIVDRYVYSGVAFSATKEVHFSIFIPLFVIIIYIIHYKLTLAVIKADLEMSGVYN